MLTDCVGQSQGQQARWCSSQISVEAYDDALLAGLPVGVIAQQADPTQFSGPGLLFFSVVGHFVGNRPGQQTQRMPEFDVFGIEVARRGRQVVRGHRGQAQFAPPLGLQGPATARVDFEPQDRRSEQSALMQKVPSPWLDRAEVFTDHHRARPMGLQRDDADHRLVVVAHVCALGGRLPLGIHHSRNIPMMWSIRTPPEWRRTAATNARKGW